MTLNGIIKTRNLNDYSSEAKAQFNFNKFNTNVFLDNMDRINKGQKLVSRELRNRLKEAAEERDDDDINYSLYVKEDENNNKKSESRVKNPEHHNSVILNPGASMMVAPGRTSSPAECQTCANRKYQDGSDESDVSFQTPTHISPSIAATVILGHEHEHVANAYEKEHMSSINHDHVHAHVDSASVQLKVDICPECGKVFFSGGVTNTVISYTDDEQYEKQSGDQHFNPNIFVPSSYKSSFKADERLQELLNEANVDIVYFDDPSYKEANPYVIIPLSLKDRLTKEEYIEFLEEVTNLKIQYHDDVAEEEKKHNPYKGYKIFVGDGSNFPGDNVDMNS